MNYDASPNPETRDLASSIRGGFTRQFAGYDPHGNMSGTYDIEIVLQQPGDSVSIDDFANPLMGPLLFTTRNGTYMLDAEQVAFLGHSDKNSEFNEPKKFSMQFGDGTTKPKFDSVTVDQTPSFLIRAFNDKSTISSIELAGEIFGDTRLTGSDSPQEVGLTCVRVDETSPFHHAKKLFAPVVEKYRQRNAAIAPIAGRTALN